jgi:uncharacterized sporulation protein YeaH/YhbH (DUF444 family)
MTNFIDRRLNGKNKSAINRQRFIKRYKEQIKQAIADNIHKRSVADTQHGEKINIPLRDINEPVFQHGQGGYQETVLSGNKEFTAGERIPRPFQADSDQKGQASNYGQGEDDFSFELSREEFYELFFDDLALPHLVKTQLLQEPHYKLTRTGYNRTGVPTKLNIIRSLKNSLGRRIGLIKPYQKELSELQAKLALLEQATAENQQLVQLKQQISLLKHKIKAVPYLDNLDLRYNYYTRQPEPTSQAVMFCIMDVSGSMDETKKDLAKRFFMLLYLFLTHNYEKIELVFIRHHTLATEVTEEEFFYSRETGGTVVSSALELMQHIIQVRYPSADWNIYAAQASDGDNWNADSPQCKTILLNSIMPYVQYYAYLEIMPRERQSLWQAYLAVKERYPNFAMQEIHSAAEIYPVLRMLFKKDEMHES